MHLSFIPLEQILSLFLYLELMRGIVIDASGACKAGHTIRVLVSRFNLFLPACMLSGWFFWSSHYDAKIVDCSWIGMAKMSKSAHDLESNAKIVYAKIK
jgi:hypothetical protein